MLENFNITDFNILSVLCLTNILSIICIIYLLVTRNKKISVIDKPLEVKVTQVSGDTTETSDFDEIMDAMQKDLDSKKEDAIELFEQEQEEKAIISYQELLNVKNKPEDNSDEIIEKVEMEEELPETKVIPKLVTTKESKFTNSEFVSPVFGKMDPNNKNNLKIESEKELDSHDLEKTLNIEPLSDEIKKNNQFLTALKEFRKNL